MARTRRLERGVVTAELAMALPVLLAVTLGLVWLLSLASAQVRMIDATREVARAVARGDDTAEAITRGREVAPEGARLRLMETGDRILVSGTVEVDGLGGVLGVLPSVRLTADALTVREETP